MIRPLDSLESYFATMNRHVPTHFVMAASLTYAIEDERWAAAFRALQQRDLFLRATIHQESTGRLVFVEAPNVAVPITILPRTSADDWKLRYAEQVQQPLASHDAPLVRIVVMRNATRTDLVMACHHAVSDAMGVVFLLRDLFTVLNGQEPPPIPQDIPRSVDTLWRERRPGLQPLDLPQPPPSARRYLTNSGLFPEIHTAVLSKVDTAALRARAAEREVSLHAVLYAASLLAGGRQSVGWQSGAVRFATPVDLRGRFGLSDTFCLALTAFGHSHQYAAGSEIWAVAAEINAVLLASTTDAALLMASKALGALMQAGVGGDVLPLLVAFSPAYEIMVSNLRVLPLALPAGPLQLDAVWGPTTLQQFDGQQSLGLLTYGDQLHLTYASYTAIPGLAKELIGSLRSAAQGSPSSLESISRSAATEAGRAAPITKPK